MCTEREKSGADHSGLVHRDYHKQIVAGLLEELAALKKDARLLAIYRHPDCPENVKARAERAEHMAELWKGCARKLYYCEGITKLLRVNEGLTEELERAERELAALKKDARALAEIIAPLPYAAGPLRDIAERIIRAIKETEE